MPNERMITEIETLLSELIELGGKKEKTSIIPNMLVRNAAPSGLSDYIIIADNRDNDNILALKVPGVVYSNNDLVNVIFVEGGEAIAFQQGSGSSSSGLWAIVPATSTDIYYNQGDVGIGKAVAPDAALEVLSTSQAQLRLTHTEDTKFVDFTLDTNHDLTITPSSTGQIKLQPTTDSTDFFQVLDADGGTPILNVDSTNERVGIGTASPASPLNVASDAGSVPVVTVDGTTTTHALDIVPNINPGAAGAQTLRFVPQVEPTANVGTFRGVNTNIRIGGSSAFTFSVVSGFSTNLELRDAYAGGITDYFAFVVSAPDEVSSAAPTITNAYGYYCEDLGSVPSNTWAFYAAGDDPSYFGGNVGIGIASQSRFHLYDTISGAMHWKYDGLDGTSRTIIANGAGDVLYNLTGRYNLRDSSGNVADGAVSVANGGSQAIAVGANTVTIAVAGAGTTTISRTAGADTIKVGLWLLWL